MIPFRFSKDGKALAAIAPGWNSLRVWNSKTGKLGASINEDLRDATFAADGRVLVVTLINEIRFYDLANPGGAPRRVPVKHFASALAVTPDDGLVALGTGGGQVQFFDPVTGKLIDYVHGHMNGVSKLAFSQNGRRLITVMGGREALKLWDVATRQELLTLSGVGSYLNAARWSADGDTILAGAPWQAWSAPSWEKIAADEAKEAGNARR